MEPEEFEIDSAGSSAFGEPLNEAPATKGSIDITVRLHIPSKADIAEQAAAIVAGQMFDDKQIIDHAHELAREMIQRGLADRVAVAIEALLGAPMQRTDGWGNPVGAPTSLAELIQHEATQYLETIVDHDGRAVAPTAYRSGANKKRIDHLVAANVREMFREGVRAHTSKMLSEIKDATVRSISADIAKAISDKV